ncbi:MAG: hypothetical protein ACRYG8_47330 [Janthinobacterium lividum]
MANRFHMQGDPFGGAAYDGAGYCERQADENADLMVKSFPGVPLEPETEPNGTLLSIAEARRVLGYVPLFTPRE